jgi:hypothetical protein
MRFGVWIMMFVAGITLVSCSLGRFQVPVTGEVDTRSYASLYPYYAEYCALSQFAKKPGLDFPLESGIGGHAVLYLNGVCRNTATTLALCRPAEAAQKGVGLSVNSHYKNAKWVATEGRDFFYHGDLPPGAPLTWSGYQRTLAKAREMGIFDGVEFHDEVFDDKPAGMSREEFKYAVSVPTDFAIDFGRDRYCARVPMSRAQMGRVVEELNEQNAPYKDGTKSFEWSVFNNNCVHSIHNALAAAGLWPRLETERFIVFAALDFPVPKNEFVNLMQRTNDLDIADARTLYRDETARRGLIDWGSLPTRPGAIASVGRARQENEIYEIGLAIIFYDDPLFGSYAGHWDRIFSESHYSDLQANLEHFARLYRSAAARLTAPPDTTGLGAEASAYGIFYERLQEHMRQQARLLDAQLASLRALEEAAR